MWWNNNYIIRCMGNISILRVQVFTNSKQFKTLASTGKYGFKSFFLTNSR